MARATHVWAMSYLLGLLGCASHEPAALERPPSTTSATPSRPMATPANAAVTPSPTLAFSADKAASATSSADKAAHATSSPTVTAPAPTQSAKGSERDQQRKPCRLLAVGDSLTDRKSAGGGYLSAVTAKCACEVTNLGKGGDMVNQMKPRLLRHLNEAPHRYDFVLVFGGVNDLYSDETAHRSVTKITRDLTAMYRAAREQGAQVIALTVTPWGGFRRWYSQKRGAATQELNAWIRKSGELGLTDYVVDAYAVLSCGSPERLCDRYAAPFKDGLHFGHQGHDRLGAKLVEAIGMPRCPSTPTDGPAPP